MKKIVDKKTEIDKMCEDVDNAIYIAQDNFECAAILYNLGYRNTSIVEFPRIIETMLATEKYYQVEYLENGKVRTTGYLTKENAEKEFIKIVGGGNRNARRN